MANSNTQVDELKKELFEMQDKQKQIEDELMMHRIILEQNKVGMKDKLVDKDDFPRSDIDVYAVRQARSSIIRLENDVKDLIERMKLKLEELHSATSGRQQQQK